MTNIRNATGHIPNASGGTLADPTGLVGGSVMSQPSASIHGGNPVKVYSNVTTPTIIQDGNKLFDLMTVVTTRASKLLVLGDV